ncbi:MAG: hypothetical protein R3236_04565 [Phycisphaeraceae bacterium]|nr:hypothetical protein [Phycisphaeraceae bacterium]
MFKTGKWVSLFVVLVLAVGCVSPKQAELEQVAKDWCLTIRAAQVIPVYPLSEDLQPGDVFLVTTPIQRQAEAYARRGFLPLDQHMGRLEGIDYAGFYKSSHSHTWAGPKPDQWDKAPRAAFPVYNFSVSRGTGIQAALPIKGIPVGLSLMGTDSATGSVTIADAYTYGVSFDRLVADVEAWAVEADNLFTLLNVRKAQVAAEKGMEKMFRRWAGRPEPTVYLRVINRVYLTGQVAVSINKTAAGGTKATGGAAQNLTVPDFNDQAASENYTKMLGALDQKINGLAPGGELRTAWATNRSVSMVEKFKRPLVIGYLAFDFPVLEDGRLGAPVATRKQLAHAAEPARPVQELSEDQYDSIVLERAVGAIKNKATRKEVYDAAAAKLGGEFKRLYESKLTRGSRLAFSAAKTEVTRAAPSKAKAVHRIYHALRNAYEQAGFPQ